MGRATRVLVAYGLGYTVLLEALLFVEIWYWPNFEEHFDKFRVILPMPSLQTMLDMIEEAGVFGYIAGEHFFKDCNTLGTAAAVLFSVGAVAGEAHRGTLEIWLARPVSRFRLLGERWLAGAVTLALPIFVTSATIPWLAERVDEIVPLKTCMLASFHQTCVLLPIYGLTFLLSTVGSHPTRIAVGVLFLSTFTFAMYMVEYVTDWSYFRLGDIEDHLRIDLHERLDWSVCGPLLVATVLLFVVAQLAFRRRVP